MATKNLSTKGPLKQPNINNLKISLIGECMIELQDHPGKGVQQTFGGDTLNTAIYMARLARIFPLTVDYVTAIGTDPFSKAMMAFWESEGVGSSLVQHIDGKLPGLYYIFLDSAGERTFHYWRGESAARRCFDNNGSETVLSRLEAYDAVYISGISLAILEPAGLERLITKLYDLNCMGKAIFFDFNYRPHLWPGKKEALEVYKRILSISHTVLLNREEGESLLGHTEQTEMHRILNEAGVRESVVRDGEAPCSIYTEGDIYRVAALKDVKVVDTTAAGDSFSAAYLVARMFGVDVENAALLGHRLAAEVISCKGAVAPMSAMPFWEGVLAETPGAD